MAVDTAVSAGTLPEPAVDPLFYGLKEVLADLDDEPLHHRLPIWYYIIIDPFHYDVTGEK